MLTLPSYHATKSIQVPQAAEETICQELAAEVRVGSASRFDYMATRCPALLLTEPQGK